jgi:hypothetical protein
LIELVEEMSDGSEHNRVSCRGAHLLAPAAAAARTVKTHSHLVLAFVTYLATSPALSAPAY